MHSRQITHRNIFRVLIAGFGVVLLMLLGAAVVGVRNIRSIQQNAASLVREQSVTNRLIDELQRQQTSVGEVFSVLARDPDSVDYDRIMSQLDAADTSIERICAEGAQTFESRQWERLRRSSNNFSNEARRLLTAEEPETFASMDLFRYHASFISAISQLIGLEYRKVSEAQAQVDRLTSRLLESSLVFAGGSVLLALVFSVITVRMVSELIRRMNWQTEELGRVSFHMLEDQESTARRFSHELHDELGQCLTAVKTNLTTLESNGRIDPSRREDCIRLVDEAIGDVRQMSQLLRPTILDDFGLEAGLRWLADGFAARTSIDVDFKSDFHGRLPDETETHLFRIAQEALTNVARHAGAKHVRIELESAGGEIRLTLADDGRGLGPPAPDRRGLGLIGMRARARSAGGDVNIRSRPGEGVVIEVQVPLRNETHTNPAG